MTRLCLILAGLCACGLVVLAIRPRFDLDVARTFYVGTEHFIGNTRIGVIVRYTAWIFPFALFFAMVLAAVAGKAGVADRWAPGSGSLAFAALSLALGPGLLVHAMLKEVSHRPRPYSVTEFGGRETFRPFYRFDGACRHNCSFPSGETAAATWTLAPASLVPPPWRALALAGAVVFAGGTGLLRMAFGGHFLSDVCGAALITILVILLARASLLRLLRARGGAKPR